MAECAHCGNEFIKHRHNQKYHTLECRKKASAKRELSQLKQNKNRFTEQQWKDKGAHVCKSCGTKFIPIRAERKKYCSRECAFHEKTMKANPPDGGMSICECKHCGKLFVAVRVVVLFCSKKCRRAYNYDSKREEILSDQRARQRKLKKEIICKECGESFMGYTNRLYCTNKCARRTSKRKRKRAIRGRRKETVGYMEIYTRDHGACHICGKRVFKKYPKAHTRGGTLDHVIAVANGGEHSYDNIKLAHRECNMKKGSKRTWRQVECIYA